MEDNIELLIAGMILLTLGMVCGTIIAVAWLAYKAISLFV